LPLIQCPECNKSISDKATACPECGYPLRQEAEQTLLMDKLTAEDSWLIESGSLGVRKSMQARFDPSGNLLYRWGPSADLSSVPMRQGRWNSSGNLLFLEIEQNVGGGHFCPTHLTVEVRKIDSDRITGVDQWSREWLLKEASMILTQETVTMFVEFFEWLFGFHLTQSQRQEIRKSLSESWLNQDYSEIELARTIWDLHVDLGRHSEEEREVRRAQSRYIILSSLQRNDDNDVSRLLLQVYKYANELISEGNPPLTRQASDAYVEVLCFMASEIQGDKPYVPNTEEKNAFAKQLAAVYNQLSHGQQEGLATMPMYWSWTRAMWPTLPEVEREEHLVLWREDLRALMTQPQTINNEENESPEAPPPVAPPSEPGSPKSVSDMWAKYQSNHTGVASYSNIMRMNMELYESKSKGPW
jgi:hypothetical protein